MPVTNPTRITVLDEGAIQGLISRVDFTGAGVTASVSGPTATVNIPGGAGGDIALTLQAPSTDETITAGYSAIVNRKYTIASGKKLTIGSGAIFRIH